MLIHDADTATQQELDALWSVIDRDGPLDGVAVETVFMDCLDVPAVDQLPLDECTDLIATLERLRARVDGIQQQALVQVAEALEERERGRHGPALAEKGYYLDQLACLLHISPVTARDRICQARMLVRHFPQVLALVKAGTVSLLQARMMYLAAEPVIDRLAANGQDVQAFTLALQDAIVPRLPDLTCGEVKTRTARLVARLAPQTVEQAHADAYAGRKVTAWPLPDGMALLQLSSGADQIAQVFTALTACAQKNGADDDRSMDQRRADQLHTWSITALNALGNDALGNDALGNDALGNDTPTTNPATADPTGSSATAGPASPGKPAGSTGTASAASAASAAGPVRHDSGAGCGQPLWQGRRPAIQVSVALSTLLGLDEQPGELAGHGPIPASLARRIAADRSGTWSRIITDQAGKVLDYEQRVYRPPADLREHVLTRDPTCRFPGCNRSTRRGELDHMEDFARGGHTCASNLHGLCRRHHHLKSETDWRVHRDPVTGDTTWTDPDGRQSITRAHTLPVDATVSRPVTPNTTSPNTTSASTTTSANDPPPF